MKRGPRPPERGTAAHGDELVGHGGAHGAALGDSVGLLRLLASGTTGDDLAIAALLGPLEPAGTNWVALHHLDRHRHALVLVGAANLSPTVRGPLALVPTDAALPLTQVLRTSMPMAVGLAEAVERFPIAHFLLEGRPAEGRRLACVPSRCRGVIVGTVTVGVADASSDPWTSADTLQLVADALAVWLALMRPADPLSVAAVARPLLQLTERQRAILDLVGRGRTNAQIARELDYSTATVKSDLAAMYRLFGVRVRTDLVARAAAAADDAAADDATATDDAAPADSGVPAGRHAAAD